MAENTLITSKQTEIVKGAIHYRNFRARSSTKHNSSRPHQQEVSKEFAFHLWHLAGHVHQQARPIAVHVKLFSTKRHVDSNVVVRLITASISCIRGKHPPNGCKRFGSYSHQPNVAIFLFSRIFRSCIGIFWTFFQFCPCVTTVLTNFVHASRCSGRIFNFVQSSQSS